MRPLKGEYCIDYEWIRKCGRESLQYSSSPLCSPHFLLLHLHLPCPIQGVVDRAFLAAHAGKEGKLKGLLPVSWLIQQRISR